MKQMIIFLLGVNGFLSAQIPLGLEANQIGVDHGGTESWMPLFFAQDKDSNYYIPDFFNERIAIFTSEGSFKGDISLENGLEPSLNYFARSPHGDFVIYSSFTFSAYDSLGKFKWDYPFPMGYFPQGFYLTSEGISLKVESNGFFFPWAGGPKSGRVHHEFKGARQLAIVEEVGSPCFNLGDQSYLYDWDLKTGEAKAVLVNRDKEGNTYWALRRNQSWRIWSYSAKGELIKFTEHSDIEGATPLLSILVNSQGQWTSGGIKEGFYNFEKWK